MAQSELGPRVEGLLDMNSNIDDPEPAEVELSDRTVTERLS